MESSAVDVMLSSRVFDSLAPSDSVIVGVRCCCDRERDKESAPLLVSVPVRRSSVKLTVKERLDVNDKVGISVSERLVESVVVPFSLGVPELVGEPTLGDFVGLFLGVRDSVVVLEPLLRLQDEESETELVVVAVHDFEVVTS
jgi:hypothetical protein